VKNGFINIVANSTKKTLLPVCVGLRNIKHRGGERGEFGEFAYSCGGLRVASCEGDLVTKFLTGTESWFRIVLRVAGCELRRGSSN
jgi:hypothetical protein